MKIEVNNIYQGDAIELIKDISDTSIHLLLSDIPYNIGYDSWDVKHNNTNSALLGHSPAQDKSKVFKTRGKPLNGWSKSDREQGKEYYNWCLSWIKECYRILVPGASCFIFAGRRYSHQVINAFEDSRFTLKDQIAWIKTQASYKAQKVSSVFERRGDIDNAIKYKGWKLGNLRPLFEPILWFQKPYKIGGTLTDNLLGYGVGAFNEEVLKDDNVLNTGIEVCSNIIRVKSNEEDRGQHPTQKPLQLMKFLIELVTKEKQIVIDPFAGSGTTCLASKELDRCYIGIEVDKDYCEIAKDRLK